MAITRLDDVQQLQFPVSPPQTRKSRPISRSALYAAVNENQAYSYVYLLPLAYDLNAYVAGRSVGGFGQRRFRRCQFRICFCACLRYQFIQRQVREGSDLLAGVGKVQFSGHAACIVRIGLIEVD